jgi:hypothetical protein
LTPKITYQLAAWATQQRFKSHKYETNRIIPAVDTFCRLKAFAGSSSCIKQWRKQLGEICEACNISVSSLMRRINWLQQQGWIDTTTKDIRLQSWHTIHERLEITYDRVFFAMPNKIKEDDKRTFYWIYLAEIEYNKSRQAYMIHKKLNKNHEVKTAVYTELKKQNTDLAMCDKSPGHLLIQLQSLYINSFVFGSEIHDVLVSIRPDTNRSCIGMGAAWSNDAGQRIKKTDKQLYTKRAMRASYIKSKLVKENIAVIQAVGTIESECRMRNKECHVMYNKANKTTFQAMCDDVIVKQPRTASLPVPKTLAA